jgi:glycosyltransferase involved in cell wall biosynthesis
MPIGTSKKIILISYFFSSKYETGGIRVQKFAKYLPCFGMEPIVITRKIKDPFLFEGRCISLRTLPIHWPFHLESFTWMPGLLWACLNLIKNEKVKVLVFSCGPFPMVVVGVILKKLFNVKLILDYRDYWTLSPQIPKMSGFRRFVNQLLKPLEAWVLKFTDRLILARRKMESDYICHLPFLDGKTETIFNGFDEDDIPKIADEGSKYFSKFTVLYLGNLHLDLNLNYPVLFLEGLQRMKVKNLLDESNFQFLIVGENSKALSGKVMELGLSGIVKTLGKLPHSEGLHYLSRSHLLLLLNETEAIFPSKSFEYLATGKPILALTKPGELMDLIREFSPHSKIITSYQTEEIVKGIERSLQGKVCYSEGRELTERFRREFNRKELTRRLVKVLMDLPET